MIQEETNALGVDTAKVQKRLPSGNLTELWKITIFYGKIHYKWPFSIAIFDITRGYPWHSLTVYPQGGSFNVSKIV